MTIVFDPLLPAEPNDTVLIAGSYYIPSQMQLSRRMAHSGSSYTNYLSSNYGAIDEPSCLPNILADKLVDLHDSLSSRSMAPSNNTTTAASAQPTVSTAPLPPYNKSLPVASVVVLAFCILLMNYAVGYVLFHQCYHRKPKRASKKKPRATQPDEKVLTAKSRWRIGPLILSKLQAGKTTQEKSHTSTLDLFHPSMPVPPPSALFSPTKHVQTSRLEADFPCHTSSLEAVITPDPHDMENQTTSTPSEQQQSHLPTEPSIDTTHDKPPLSSADVFPSSLAKISHPQEVHLASVSPISIRISRIQEDSSPGTGDLFNWARDVHGRPPQSPKEIIEDMMTNPKLSPIQGPIEFLEVHRREQPIVLRPFG
ncbi:hypothetical protein BJ138DRAFT_1121129 [Hygrophoropsis aurantiaca]|uniref:Uncharacterized protein n=1 Tax=Hygrophoropsis aurantiaca TaxID=72124 RepID=A0ACB7ZPL0_9AGAM|nr:hypothetical protein BJ138DRAFT_1121129 [Hygrophoropsis aurantiaca]